MIIASTEGNENFESAEIYYNLTVDKANLNIVTIAAIADQTYTGSAIEPSITVTLNGKAVDTAEYAVSYSNNTNVSTATAPTAPTVTLTATGSRNFTEETTKQATFTIVAKALTEGMVTLSSEEFTYNGELQKPTVTVKDGETTLVIDTDYTLSNNGGTEAGDYSIEVVGQGNYTGTITKEFTIKDRTAEISFGNGLSYQTYYKAEEDFLVPDGVKAYLVTGTEGTVVTVKEVSYLKAGVPLLLEKAEDATSEKDPDETFTGNLLRYAEDAVTTTGSEYVLYLNEFLKATETIPQGRCYLDLTGTGNAGTRGFTIGNGTTGIKEVRSEGVNSEKWANGEWFDLQGHRIQKPTKTGLYIQNGKKVVIK